MALQPGDKLQNGKYTIVRELGRGESGITYLAKDRQDKNLVIKALKDDMYDGRSPDEINRFHNKLLAEAAKLAQCQNPHIVKFQGSLIEAQRVYLAMEHIAGDDLAMFKNQKLSESEALNYIKQIGQALTEVHKNGLLHLDVKPENIILRAGKAEVVLIDFGLARELDEDFSTHISSTAEGFAALELYDRSAERGPYTDVYGLAATLYCFVTGKMPPSALQISMRQKKLVAPKKINSRISDKLNKAIMDGMELDRENRPQTIEEWLNLLPSLPGKNPSPKKPKWKEWLENNSTWIKTVEAILGVIVIVLGWYFSVFSRKGQEANKSNPSDTPPSIESPSQE